MSNINILKVKVILLIDPYKYLRILINNLISFKKKS